MNPIDRDMRELAAVRSDGEPVVSLYLDTRWDDEQNRGRVRIFVRDAFRDAKAHYAGKMGESLDRTAARVQDVVLQLVRQARDYDAGGVAIFACEGLGLFRMLTFHTPFQNELRISELPDLVQLAGLVSRLGPMAIVAADNEGCEIVETDLGQVQADLELIAESPHLTKMGGWSQFRYQRHVRRIIRENMEPAARYLKGLCIAEPRLLVAVAGPDRSVAELWHTLDANVRSRVFFKFPRPPNRDGLVRKAQEALASHGREQMTRSIDDVTSGEAIGRGLSALGLEDVIMAVNEGRVHELFLMDGLRESGWRCLFCGALGYQETQVCTYCAGELRTAELASELTRRLALEGGRVQLVDDSPFLARSGGMCAALRHSRAPGYAATH